ncbi:MAG: polysulfide reductase NrfD [Deltaproteobacteria bacterium]|nr:polysulfide reductase NrfD [Deltaproteobacteria bacterium]
MLLSNYVFPNDLHVHWSMMIVLYPYLSGLVDGAFIVAALYYVFGVKSLRPVSRFSLVFAMAFLFCAMMPLMLHLGRPERNLNMMITPSPSSAMAGAGYIYTLAVGVLVLVVLFVYRPTLVRLRVESKGLMKLLYRVLTVDTTNLTPKAIELDRKIIRFLVAVGIPVATIFHGYVGFLFGGVKANPTWSTPLIPVIFLFSACVSGISGIILAYVLIKGFRKEQVDVDCLRTLINTLAGFFILALSFEMLDVFSHSYLRSGYHHMVEGLLNGPLFHSFWLWQVVICSGIPVIILGWLCLTRVRDSIFKVFAAIVSFMLLLQVLFMRWNVVIGGQLMSKSARGYTEFHPEWFDKEGIIAVIFVMAVPFILLFILGKIFPFWLEGEKDSI